MGLQIKQFANGVKAVLKPQAKGKQAVLQIFDKENCMIAQREIKSTVTQDGIKSLEKLTIRQGKEGRNQMEYIRTAEDSCGSWWESTRSVQPEYGDVYVNINKRASYGKYFKNFTQFSHSKETAFNSLKNKFPLLKPTTTPEFSKKEELQTTLQKMWEQWYNPKTSAPRKEAKPMMPKFLRDMFG